MAIKGETQRGPALASRATLFYFASSPQPKLGNDKLNEVVKLGAVCSDGNAGNPILQTTTATRRASRAVRPKPAPLLHRWKSAS